MYTNTTSCFNIILGQLQHVMKSHQVIRICFQVDLQNVKSVKNKLHVHVDILHSSMVAHFQQLGMLNFFALTETWLPDDVLE